MINWVDKVIERFSLQKYLREVNFSYLILAVTFIIGIYLNWTLEEIIMVMFVIWHIMQPLRASTLLNILSLLIILIPFILIVHRPEMAEPLAISVFILIILLLFELGAENKKP